MRIALNQRWVWLFPVGILVATNLATLFLCSARVEAERNRGDAVAAKVEIRLLTTIEGYDRDTAHEEALASLRDALEWIQELRQSR